MVEKGQKVKYIGAGNSVLVQNEIYKVYSVSEGGIQVYIPTGFAGMKNKEFTVINN
jgi:hypothetical protein